MINKLEMAVLIDFAISSNYNIKEKVHKKLKNSQGLKEEIAKLWRFKVSVVPVVMEHSEL